MAAQLEHANITVEDPKKIAQELVGLFDWSIRWEGTALDNGYSVHVGNETSYLAVYSPASDLTERAHRYTRIGALNHIGVVVDDIAATEARVREMGYDPHSHADYEPGQRFYFEGPGEVEYEVVSYA